MTARDDRLAAALQDCLARTRAGESPEQVLADQPADLRAELHSALVAALTLRHRRPMPAPAFADRLHGQLDEAMAELVPPPPQRARWGLAWTAPRFALRLTAVLTAVVVAGMSLTFASANSRPGDLLYPVHALVQRLGAAGLTLLPGAVQPVPEPNAPANPGSPPSATTSTPAATAVARQGVDAALRSADGEATQARDRAATGAVAQSRLVAPMATMSPATATRTVAASPTAVASPTRTVPALRPTTTPTLVPATATEEPTAPPPPDTEEPPDASPTPQPTPEGGPGAISGRITGRDGRPVEGARVRAVRFDDRDGPGGRGGPGGPPGREAVTDTDGRYRIEALRPGAYRVSAEDADPRRGPRHWYPDGRDERDAEPVTVRTGASTEGIDIALERRPGAHGDQPGVQPSASPTAANPTPTDLTPSASATPSPTPGV
jgi:hypothetical protein